jgi:CBS domain-containing protein
VRQALIDHDIVDLLIAHDLIMEVPVIRESDPLSIAIQKLKQYDIENIPVVSSKSNDEFIGIITHRDIMESYNRMINEAENSEYLTDSYYGKK